MCGTGLGNRGLDSDSIMEQPLSPAELHALKILAKGAEDVRGRLTGPCTMPLDFGVHITGTLIVNADTQVNSSTAASNTLIIAALLSYFGPRKRATVVEEILDSGLAKAVKDPEQTKALAETLVEGLKTRALAPRRGAVTGQFTVVPVHIKP